MLLLVPPRQSWPVAVDAAKRANLRLEEAGLSGRVIDAWSVSAAVARAKE